MGGGAVRSITRLMHRQPGRLCQAAFRERVAVGQEPVEAMSRSLWGLSPVCRIGGDHGGGEARHPFQLRNELGRGRRLRVEHHRSSSFLVGHVCTLHAFNTFQDHPGRSGATRSGHATNGQEHARTPARYGVHRFHGGGGCSGVPIAGVFVAGHMLVVVTRDLRKNSQHQDRAYRPPLESRHRATSVVWRSSSCGRLRRGHTSAAQKERQEPIAVLVAQERLDQEAHRHPEEDVGHERQ